MRTGCCGDGRTARQAAAMAAPVAAAAAAAERREQRRIEREEASERDDEMVEDLGPEFDRGPDGDSFRDGMDLPPAIPEDEMFPPEGDEYFEDDLPPEDPDDEFIDD